MHPRPGRFGSLLLAACGGVLVTLAAVALLLRAYPCNALAWDSFSTLAMPRLPLQICSDAGRYDTFSGVWFDGIEESRFFPGAQGAPSFSASTGARLEIDHAARDLVVANLPRSSRPIARQGVFVQFEGLELHPHAPLGHGVDRVFQVRRIVSARLLRREY